METGFRILPNLYRDSVSLMQLSNDLSSGEGVQEAYAVMGTEANLNLLRDAGVDTSAISAGPNDLVVVIEADDEARVSEALERAEALLRGEATMAPQEAAERKPHSVGAAVRMTPGANLALISTPGEYAAAEAIKALAAGLHVMIFSDNVSVNDEVRIKEMAHERGLLAMGPDCGTAIINGVPLAFANVVRRGNIGAIGASGTGLQQVTCLIDRWGGGISQAIGTGSRDLSERVGAIAMLDALVALQEDPGTQVIVLISKPPAEAVAKRVLDQAVQSRKPVVVNFIGATLPPREGLTVATSLDEAASMAVGLAGGTPPGEAQADPLSGVSFRFASGQRYLRGPFSGGTFSYEATLLLQDALGPVHSNTPVAHEYALADPWHSLEHTTVDLGDDEFTRGRPHPMIDYRLRLERLQEEAEDPEVALILLDVVLGYGSHPNPAAELVPAITRARETARAAGRDLAVVASVCGTEGDPQVLSRQEAALREAGVILGRSNAHAARLAARIMQQVGAAGRQARAQGDRRR